MRWAGGALSVAWLLAACGAGTEPVAEGTAVSGVAESEAVTPEPEPTTTEASTTTTVAETTTTSSPYLVNLLEGANGAAETSQQATETGQLPVKTYDRFELAPGASVGIIQWRGIYSFCQERDGVPDPHASAFVIEVFGDDAGQPDLPAGPIYTATIDIDDTNQTLDGTRDQPCQNRPESTWAFYDYEATLQTPFMADDGGAHWLVIQAVTPGFGTFWGWESSSSGPPSLQEFNGDIKEVTSGARAYALLAG
ncbi:MAG: hypothetical protein AAFN30_01735 [Actinomycetota bacterium]